MKVRAGERSERGGRLRCENCGAPAVVGPGHRVPKCRSCGYAGFATAG